MKGYDNESHNSDSDNSHNGDHLDSAEMENDGCRSSQLPYPKEAKHFWKLPLTPTRSISTGRGILPNTANLDEMMANQKKANK